MPESHAERLRAFLKRNSLPKLLSEDILAILDENSHLKLAAKVRRANGTPPGAPDPMNTTMAKLMGRQDVPDYLGDIRATWGLVDYLYEQGYDVMLYLSSFPETNFWVCTIWGNGRFLREEADSASLAIYKSTKRIMEDKCEPRAMG